MFVIFVISYNFAEDMMIIFKYYRTKLLKFKVGFYLNLKT